MSGFLLDWGNLIFRWGHIIAGVGWIGASFYFVALDFSLRKRDGEDHKILGSSWLVHGGGFYHVEKYTVAPSSLPEKLIWYKWDAYATWLTGFSLLILQYYLNADVYLIDSSKADLSSSEAIFFSMIGLFVGWVIYDTICRLFSEKRPLLLAGAVFALVLLSAWAFSNLYSDRGALIHVGVFVGTIMAGNVFFVIMPNQRKIVRDLLDQKKPDSRLEKQSKQRSLHNNYLTLPVLLMMVSNHYPFLAGQNELWLAVGLIVCLGAAVRHFINRHEAGDDFKSFAWTLPLGVLAFLGAVIITAPDHRLRASTSVDEVGGKIADSTVLAITKTHCVSCHAANPSSELFVEAPKGVYLETLDDLRKYRGVIEAQAIMSTAMPLGNMTAMTEKERSALGQWLSAQVGQEK